MTTSALVLFIFFPARRSITMILFLEHSLRKGVVPLCCAGASLCFTIYGAKIFYGAHQWELLSTLPKNYSSLEKEKYSQTARSLYQHGGTSMALAFTSTATTFTALQDWQSYRRSKDLDAMLQWIVERHRLFVLRTPVIATAIASFAMADYWTGSIRWTQPPLPAVLVPPEL